MVRCSCAAILVVLLLQPSAALSNGIATSLKKTHCTQRPAGASAYLHNSHDRFASGHGPYKACAVLAATSVSMLNGIAPVFAADSGAALAAADSSPGGEWKKIAFIAVGLLSVLHPLLPNPFLESGKK